MSLLQHSIRVRPVDSKISAQLNTEHPVMADIFAARGVTSHKELDYRLQNLTPPTGLAGVDAASTILFTALQAQQRIIIVGDFDADGATSTAVAVRCLRALGFQHVDYLVPNRFEYGYGLTPEIVEVGAQCKPDVLITVDNGISSIQGVARAKELGIQVIVTDHHLPGDTLPAADAIVNPNQHECDFPCKSAAGVGVIFYVMTCFRSYLKAQGWFESRPLPNFAEYLDLVALGTVADVVPLEHNNRVLVAQGLERIRAGKVCPGISAIVQVGGRQLSELSSTDLGFVVGPRLNAAGRLDDMSLGIRCLLSDSSGEALALAQELDALNRDRRSIESAMQKEAQVYLETLEAEAEGDLPAGVCLYHSEWHQGVIGILASRTKDRLHRPVIIFADDEQGHLKGSGRSIPGVHLRDVLDEVATKHPDILQKFGGHAMAAGLSLKKSDLPVFEKAFASAVKQHMGEDGLNRVIWVDGELAAEHITLPLAREIEAAGPWGQHFPEPAFTGVFRIISQKIVGQKHLKLVLGFGEANNIVDAIVFNIDLDTWPNEAIQAVRLVYKLNINRFRGNESVQLMVDHIEPVAVADIDLSPNQALA